MPTPGWRSPTVLRGFLEASRSGPGPQIRPVRTRPWCTRSSAKQPWTLEEQTMNPGESTPSARPGEGDIENLSVARLALADQRELWDAQTECVLTFLQDGEPTGVVMSYLVDADGTFWFATVEGRRQVRGVDQDPRVAVVVSNTG